MKIIQIINNIVVDILDAREDATKENIIVVEAIPKYVHKDGCSGELRYTPESGLYWEYIENPLEEEQEISSEEFYSMIEEVL